MSKRDCNEVVNILFLSHRKRSSSPEETLDRVFRKGLMMSGVPTAELPPAIVRSHLKVSLETRPAVELVPMTTRGPKSRVGKKVRLYSDVPVIVCVWRGNEYLIDGNRRVHYLADLGLEAKVYVCRIS